MAGQLVDIYDTPRPLTFAALTEGQGFTYEGRTWTKESENSARHYESGRSHIFLAETYVVPMANARGW